mgnify:CR=1 FL=1
MPRDHGTPPGSVMTRVIKNNESYLTNADRAETNSAGATGARNRTSHWPPGRAAACRSKATRIWRFNSVRVTARRAWRLGTTQPTQKALVVTGIAESSTGMDPISSLPVDNFVCASLARGGSV